MQRSIAYDLLPLAALNMRRVSAPSDNTVQGLSQMVPM